MTTHSYSFQRQKTLETDVKPGKLWPRKSTYHSVHQKELTSIDSLLLLNLELSTYQTISSSTLIWHTETHLCLLLPLGMAPEPESRLHRLLNTDFLPRNALQHDHQVFTLHKGQQRKTEAQRCLPAPCSKNQPEKQTAETPIPLEQWGSRDSSQSSPFLHSQGEHTSCGPLISALGVPSFIGMCYGIDMRCSPKACVWNNLRIFRGEIIRPWEVWPNQWIHSPIWFTWMVIVGR